MQCQVCNKSVTSNRAKYCSTACRQRAYRKRKKQMELARANTMTIDEHAIFAGVVAKYPDFRDYFSGFVEDYGLQCAVDLAYVVRDMMINSQIRRGDKNV